MKINKKTIRIFLLSKGEVLKNKNKFQRIWKNQTVKEVIKKEGFKNVSREQITSENIEEWKNQTHKECKNLKEIQEITKFQNIRKIQGIQKKSQ